MNNRIRILMIATVLAGASGWGAARPAAREAGDGAASGPAVLDMFRMPK